MSPRSMRYLKYSGDRQLKVSHIRLKVKGKLSQQTKHTRVPGLSWAAAQEAGGAQENKWLEDSEGGQRGFRHSSEGARVLAAFWTLLLCQERLQTIDIFEEKR